jgi:putative ABC transport system permease protein
MTKYESIRESFPWKWTVPMQLGDSYQGQPVVATNSDFFTEFQPIAGQPWAFTEGRRFARPYELVVGAEAARTTGLVIGDRVPLTHGFSGSREGGHVHDAHLFEVVGILEPTGASHDRALFTDLTGSWVLHAEDRLERENASGGSDTSPAGEEHHDHDHDHDHGHGHIHVEVEDLTDADRLITGILLAVPSRSGRSGPSAVLPQAFDMLRRDTSITVASPANQIERLFAIVGNVDQLFVAMAIAVLLSSGIGILLALWNSMEQRRRQIAILRVLGCSQGRIFSLVITESVLIGIGGALIGVLACWLGTLLAARELRERLGLVIEPELDPATILVVIAGTLVLAAAAGLGPAIRAYRTPVARNLRPIT